MCVEREVDHIDIENVGLRIIDQVLRGVEACIRRRNNWSLLITFMQGDRPDFSRLDSLTGKVDGMPEFVGITHDIDGDDAAILNLQGGGLENVASLDGDEPRQAVDKAIAQEARPAHGKDRRERREQPHDVVEFRRPAPCEPAPFRRHRRRG